MPQSFTYPFDIPSGTVIFPAVSGGATLGTSLLPFSGVYANQYATTFVSGTQNTGTITVNWNNGTSQHMNFTSAASGTATLSLTNGIAGSAYVLTTKQNVSGTVSLAWGSEVIWQGGVSGTMTTTSGTSDFFSFFYNGSKYFGSFSNNYY